ncbi:tetratricopeptide repeat protein, partial [Thermodesulfobacteriota bacterium]
MENSEKTLFSEILSSGPSPGTLFLILSRMKEEGRLRKVIEECHKALDVYPHDIRIRRLLAESYLESDQIPQAELELEKVIKQIDGLISSYSLQAEIFIRQKREKEAVEILKIYLAHRPDDDEALRLLDTLQQSEEISAEPLPVMEEVDTPLEDVREGVLPDYEGGDLPDIATATLAEVYFDQGLIEKAVETYEKVIAKNLDDVQSKRRFDEIRGIMAQDQVAEDKGEDKVREKKEKMITILETWLASIREQSKAGVS